MSVERHGFVIVLSSPSGAGKTTIERALIEEDRNIQSSISVTTRKPRDDEKEGVDYFFTSMDGFGSMIDRGELLEHAEVFGNHYGTKRSYVDNTLKNGIDLICNIDWQGHSSLVNTIPEHVVSIFVLPPSIPELEKRLKLRGDEGDTIQHRMEKATREISKSNMYDYIIVNQDLIKSVETVQAIITAERVKRSTQSSMLDLVSKLMDSMKEITCK